MLEVVGISNESLDNAMMEAERLEHARAERMVPADEQSFEAMLRRLVYRLRRPRLKIDGVLPQAEDLLRRKGTATPLRGKAVKP